MKKIRPFMAEFMASVSLLCFAAIAGLGQEKSPPVTVFPENLLAGDANFNFALMLQGDARGNYGPCG